jgi:hypothetical protein
MSPIAREENSRFDKQLNRLDHFHQFISEVAGLILLGNQGYETVWNIANRVYDRHCSPKVRFITHPDLDEPRTALSA